MGTTFVDNSGNPIRGYKARIYRILRLQPCTQEEVVAITGFYPWLVKDTLRDLFADGLIVKMRHERFFSKTNSIWRYYHPQRRYLIGIVIGSIFVSLGLNEFAYFLFILGVILLGVFISLFG